MTLNDFANQYGIVLVFLIGISTFFGIVGIINLVRITRYRRITKKRKEA